MAIIIALLFEDQLNGYLAGKRMLPGTKSAITKDYFAFVFGGTMHRFLKKTVWWAEPLMDSERLLKIKRESRFNK